MSSKVERFSESYKAYSHLRMKYWVVRSGSQYGVVHSEYALLVLSNRNSNSNERLRQWSDVYCTTRLSVAVAKTLCNQRVYNL